MTDRHLQIALEYLTLSRIRLNRISANVNDDFDPELTDIPEEATYGRSFGPTRAVLMTPKPGAADESKETPTLVKVYLDSDFVLFNKEVDEKDTSDDEKDVIVRVSVQFVSLYEWRGAAVDEQAIAAFVERNSGSHVWPYWRELLQNTLVRLGLPAHTLNMARIRKTDPNQPAKFDPDS